MKVEEVDDFITGSIEYAKMISKLPQDFVMSKESLMWISDAMKNKAERGESEEIIASHVSSYLIGYARAVIDVANMVNRLEKNDR